MATISIITPTHDDSFLSELYTTIINQTFSDWEWVILLNSGMTLDDLSIPTTDDRIRVYTTEETDNVGALKKEACGYCTSPYIAEVDHDDLLVPEALEKVVEVFQRNDDVGFVYSDNAKLTDDFTPYNSELGWTHRKFPWNGKEYYAMNTLPITPANISHIWWSPDHIRAWKKEVYDLVGGHDETLEVCDDNDLMCRMYLATRFYYIPEVLYLYRIRNDGNNTWLRKNELIQTRTVEISQKYIEQIALKWCENNRLLAIDICGGHNSPEGYTSVDLENGDITADLDEKWPFKDGEVGLIRASDAIEHLKDQQHTMSEIWRVLAPGGIFCSRTPSTDGRGAFQDPTHVTFWNENSFWYWTIPEIANFIDNKDKIFRNIRVETLFPSTWHEEHNISYVVAILDKVPHGMNGTYYL